MAVTVTTPHGCLPRRHLDDDCHRPWAQLDPTPGSERSLTEELKTAGTLLALDAVWRRVARGERRPRIVVVDEAWWLLGTGGDAGARFLQRLAKSARKHWCGLTTITQDVADVLSTDLGQAVVTNAAHQMLLGQSPQAMEASHAFAGGWRVTRVRSSFYPVSSST